MTDDHCDACTAELGQPCPECTEQIQADDTEKP